MPEPQACTFIEKEILAQVFCKMFKNTFFYRTPPDDWFWKWMTNYLSSPTLRFFAVDGVTYRRENDLNFSLYFALIYSLMKIIHYSKFAVKLVISHLKQNFSLMLFTIITYFIFSKKPCLIEWVVWRMLVYFIQFRTLLLCKYVLYNFSKSMCTSVFNSLTNVYSENIRRHYKKHVSDVFFFRITRKTFPWAVTDINDFTHDRLL